MVKWVLLALLAGVTTAYGTKIGSRIIDGAFTPISAAPFMASLRSFSTNVHFCGGAIISTRFILTAAQCTNGRANNDISVVVGSPLRNSGGSAHRSINIIGHPFFDHATLENDIALVQTATVILLTENVQTAGLYPNFTTDYLNDTKIFGWGLMSRQNPFDPIDLHSKTTKTIPNRECRLLNAGNAWRITENKLCTEVDLRSNCYGDEGGALVTNKLEIIGIASWHSNCNGSLPDVYERLEPYRLWILSHVQ
ncbi:Trypsin Blo t 3 [Pseudolycoriella hygida]|uniref:Trypsin Blo t 3 n=1 Tax=Pseudolycoriella hygida TaxID=35572 RepID=A0A9Q0N1X3_9DIPT|nr:Trypsin Blo t 3 [Pseudolycoriella hygida]